MRFGMVARMRKDRAVRIMKLLDWTHTEARRRFNAVTGSSYTSGGFSNLVAGERGVSKSLAVFLRMAVRVAQLERRLARQQGRLRRS